MIRDVWIVTDSGQKTFTHEGQVFAFAKEPDYSNKLAVRVVGTTMKEMTRLLSRIKDAYSDGEAHIFFQNGDDAWRLVACFDDSSARDEFAFYVRVEMQLKGAKG